MLRDGMMFNESGLELSAVKLRPRLFDINYHVKKSTHSLSFRKLVGFLAIMKNCKIL